LPNVRLELNASASVSIGSRSRHQEYDCDRKHWGLAMTAALQINFALWGMIICAVIKISHLAL
jgi:hypothetical protein